MQVGVSRWAVLLAVTRDTSRLPSISRNLPPCGNNEKLTANDAKIHTTRTRLKRQRSGCGKTTVVTNLAAYYAHMGYYPALLDYDEQGTALSWLSQRTADYPPIHGVEAYKHNTAVTRSWQMRMPSEVNRIIIDSPPALSGARLSEYIRQANVLIIPVLPSPIDVHNALSFIKDIILLGKMRSAAASSLSLEKQTRLGVIGNRVGENSRVYSALLEFLQELNLPWVTSLQDSRFYNHAFVEGIGVHEINDDRTMLLRQQWRPLFDWLEGKSQSNKFDSKNSTIESLSAL